MRSLTLKIFVSYWITAGLVILTLNVAGWPLHRPEFSRAMDTLLASTGHEYAKAAEIDGCNALTRFRPPEGTVFGLLHPDGSPVCPTQLRISADTLRKAVDRKGTRMARMFRLDREMFAIAVQTPKGATNIFLLDEPYAQRGFIFGVLTPSYTTICISIFFTLFLAWMLTRPLRQLRFATRELANGKLETRVAGGGTNRKDAISGLIDDFNHMADRLETSLSAQHLLLRDVSHELRSPLSRLQVALELTRQHTKNGMTAHVDRIAKEADMMNDLIGELLSLSFMESMRSIPDPGLLSLSDLMTRLVQDARFEAENTGKNISEAITPDCFISGDVVLLRRAVENVLRNAIRHTPSGGHIQISLRRDTSANKATVTVEDEGPGIPEHELNSIVQPFYRVDRSRSGDTGGTGVGLSIAARAVTLHRGELEFRNRENGGLSVSITLSLTLLSETL